MAIYIDLLETASTLFVRCRKRHGLRCTSQNLLFLSHVESNLITYIQDSIAIAKAAHEARDTSPSYLENAVDITSSNQRVPQGFQMLTCFALYYPTIVESSKRNNPVERRIESAKKALLLTKIRTQHFSCQNYHRSYTYEPPPVGHYLLYEQSSIAHTSPCPPSFRNIYNLFFQIPLIILLLAHSALMRYCTANHDINMYSHSVYSH